LLEAGFTSLLPSVHPVEQALSAAELAALSSVGLVAGPGTRERAESARSRYFVTYLDLFNHSDSPSELGRRLGLNPGCIRKRLRERSLLAIELGGRRRVPRFQFEGSVEVPGLRRILAAAGASLTPLAFAMWFLAPTSDLSSGDEVVPISPREWLLRTGDVEAVLAIMDS
jgi:hypothetical protein